MKFQLAVAALALLVLNVEAGVPNNKTMMCKGEPLGKEVWKGKHECTAKYVPEIANLPEDKDEKKKKWQELKPKIHGNLCIQLCQQTTNGVMDASGAFVAAGANAYIDGAFPAAARADLKTAYQKCATDNLVGKTLTMNNNCSDYKGMVDCVKKQFKMVCGDKSSSSNSKESNEA